MPRAPFFMGLQLVLGYFLQKLIDQQEKGEEENQSKRTAEDFQKYFD